MRLSLQLGWLGATPPDFHRHISCQKIIISIGGVGCVQRFVRISACDRRRAWQTEPDHITKQNWNQFPLVLVQSATLKQQISKFYLQIQCKKAGYHIYQSVACRECKSWLLFSEFADKILIFVVLNRWLFTARRFASTVLATAIPSVCPSVCPSVTRRYCVKTTARSTV